MARPLEARPVLPPGLVSATMPLMAMGGERKAAQVLGQQALGWRVASGRHQETFQKLTAEGELA